jgi:hypothetical protein
LSTICLGWLWTSIYLISAYLISVARITGVSHSYPAGSNFLNANTTHTHPHTHTHKTKKKKKNTWDIEWLLLFIAWMQFISFWRISWFIFYHTLPT